MPLGIARSVLTTAAPAASGGTHYGWTTNNVANSDNMASYRWTGADFTTNNLMSVVMWFRANGADADGDADDWIDGTSGGGSGSYFLQMIKDTGNSDFFRFWFTLQDFGWQMTMLDETNAYIDGRGFGNTATQAADSFDGNWNCVMVAFDSDIGGTGGGNTSGSGAEDDYQALYVNDDDYENGPAGHSRGDWDASEFDGMNMRYSATTNTTYNALNETGKGFQMGPIWIYNSYIDFRTESVRRRYYDPTNTDGFVEPTTTGTTTAGATQPDIFLYHNGTTLLNGGSDSITITETSIGTGAITVIDKSVGPGTGDTI